MSEKWFAIANPQAGSGKSKELLSFVTRELKRNKIDFLLNLTTISGDEIKLVKKATRNSLLLAPMPTASTSQILGNNECFEPYTTNIYLRRTLAGEFVVVNKHLVEDLKKIGLWSKEMKDLMVKANGSVQNIIDIPDDIKELYKTVWEMSQKTIIDMAADRGVYIDQSQSMNLFVESPTVSKLSSMHMYAWKTGLKTGMYYLRSKAKARPIQFSLEAECAMCSA